ncbi:beta strand repeat-containing protein [Deinococcus sp.]|uniref:beta strand repeat-containing protein n=1 Tax=Deinococcus sp. TaxID=47478 RepID=UPI003CC669BF
MLKRTLPLLALLPTLLLAACNQPASPSLPETTPISQPPAVQPVVPKLLGGLYEVRFQHVGEAGAIASARLVAGGLGTQALVNVADSAVTLTPLGVDTFVVGNVRHIRAVFQATNASSQPIQHLSFVPVDTDGPANNAPTPTVGSTYFKDLLTYGNTDAAGRATALTPVTGKVFSAAQGAAVSDPEATPYTALDTSPLTPSAPNGLTIAGRASSAWRSSAALAPGASTNVTFAVDLTRDTPTTDPFSFSVVLAVADDVNTAPSIAGASSAGLNIPASSPAAAPAAYVSSALGDSTDPASTSGLNFTVSDTESAASALTVTASSSDSTVATAALSGSGAARTVTLTPLKVGKADITLTVSDGALSSSYVIRYAVSKASSTPGTTYYHTEESNASSAIAVDSDYMLVADDEYNILKLYPRKTSGVAVGNFDFRTQLALPDPNNLEVDLEASTRIGNLLFWLGSHSNSKSGNARPNRYRLFATNLSGSGAASTLSYVGRYDNLRSDLIAWDNSGGHGLGAKYLGLEASAAIGVIPEAAGGAGFNIEGLSMAPGSTTTAYLGFRAPNEPTTARTKALIVPITNFAALVTGAAQATFDAPILLDLGGRGIREIKCDATGCLILAGPATGGSNFALYSWSGNRADAPQLRNDLTALATDSEGSLESIVELPGSDLKTAAADGASLRLLSDNGDTVYYGDGLTAKDLDQNVTASFSSPNVRNWQKFRSDTIAIGSAQSCTVNSVTVTPNTASVNIGGTAPFSAAVTTTPAGCPVVVTFASSDTGKATVNPQTGAATGVAAGSSNITATAQGYGTAAVTSSAATLTVNGAQDFGLTLGTPTPASFTTGTGGTASASITVNPINSYSGTPSFTVSSNPSGVTGTVVSNSPNPGYTVNLTVPSTLAAGSYSVKVTGTDGSLSRDSNTVSVTVNPLSLPNVVVYRVGDGAAALGSTATPVFLDTFSGTGQTQTAPVSTVTLPTAVNGSNRRLTASGTASSEGLISRSTDGKFILLTGYDAALGTTGVASTSTSTAPIVNRVVGRVSASGAVDTTTALTAFNANNIRSATSVDGSSFYITGNGNGVIYAPLGTVGSGTVVSNTFTNLRQVNIFGGQLYVSSGSGALRLGPVGSGTPTNTGQTITPLPGFPVITTANAMNSPFQFFFADLNSNVAGLDTLYVADDNNVSTVPGGIQKYSFDGTTWTAKGTAGTAADAYRGLTGFVNGTNVTLYAVRKGGSGAMGGGELVSLTDSSGSTGTLSGTPTLLATAPANEAFRGVALAPTP